MGLMPARYRSACAGAMLCVVAAGLLRPAGAQTVVAGPTATDVTALAGERFSLPIAVDLRGLPGTKLGAYRLSLRWKPSVLSFVSAGGGAFGTPVANSDSAAQGVLKLAGANAAGLDGVFTLATVSFQAITTAAADTFRLAFDELVAAVSIQDLRPSLVVTGAVFCGGPVWGDLDSDGLVKALDAQIVLMHAVGLPVTADTTRGDVDGDGKVNPRDALVILSRVVGLDVSQFRVGRFVVSACLGVSPASVSILPSLLALAPGDVFQARAEVRDAGGNLLVGKNLAWSSSNPAVAAVDSTGKLLAVANGTATITAAVSPGVTGTATVTVGDRHRWVVNPVLAQGRPSELGSDSFPLSTIRQAVARAAPGDTVVLGAATYTEPLSSTKRLVILGDSGAAGIPVISRPDSVAGVLSVSGRQVLRRVVVASSQRGLVIRADTVDVASVSIRSSAGPGLTVLGAQRTQLRGITVSTAGGAGIVVDSAPAGGVVAVRGAWISGVGPAPGLGPLAIGVGYEVHAAGMLLAADWVEVDSAVVAGVSAGDRPDSLALPGGILTLRTKRTLVRRTRVSDVDWRPAGGRQGALGIGADSVGTLEVGDSVIIERVGGDGVGMRGDTLRVTSVEVRDVAGRAFSADSGFERMEVVASQVRSAEMGVGARFGGSLLVRGGRFQGLRFQAVGVDSVRSVVVVGLQADSTARGACVGCGLSAIQVNRVADLQVDSCTIDHTPAPALLAIASGRVRASGNTVMGAPGPAMLAGMDSAGVRFARLQGNTVSGGAGSGIAVLWADTAEILGNTVFQRAGQFPYDAAVLLVKVRDSATVSGNRLRQNGTAGILVLDTAGVVVLDGNLIADNGASGIVLGQAAGMVRGSLNSVFRNRPFGIADFTSFGGAVFGWNNVAGNAFGVLSLGTDSLYARNSWWGAPTGPQCPACGPTPGDSISALVAFLPYADTLLTSAPADIPPSAPPVLRSLAPQPSGGAPAAAGRQGGPAGSWWMGSTPEAPPWPDASAWRAAARSGALPGPLGAGGSFRRRTGNGGARP